MRAFCRIIKVAGKYSNALAARNVMRHEMHVGERSRTLARGNVGRKRVREREGEGEGDCNKRACNVLRRLPACQGALCSDIHITTGFQAGSSSGGLRGRGVASGTPSLYLPPYLAFPIPPVCPALRSGVGSPPPFLHLITLRPTEYTPSYETLYVGRAIDGWRRSAC